MQASFENCFLITDHSSTPTCSRAPLIHVSRSGLSFLGRRIRKVFEPILEKNKVDVYLSGHVHAFERSLPVLDNVPYLNEDGGIGDGDGGDGGDAARRANPSAAESSSKMVYEDPAAPVHIVNGAGGCLEVGS